MTSRNLIIAILLGGFFLAQFTSCRKDAFLNQGGNLAFSTDTVYFDTVFTTLGSVTQRVKIYNREDRPVKINNIRIEKGDQSFFRLNVDGQPTKNISEVEIAANDSIYVFAALTVDPNAEQNPFVIDDKILIKLNERNYSVALQAYGQNAHIMRDSVLDSRNWINDMPYVIISSALVDSGQTLTIQKGVRVYMHADSKLFIAGTLNTLGTKEDSVIFQGDRLDRNYFGRDFPGEWRGLHFLGSSTGSNLNHTIIKNGGASDASVYVQPPNMPFVGNQYMLQMNKCRVENSLGYGIQAFKTAINLNNCLVHSCGRPNFAAFEGGRYNFNYCTFATYGSASITHINQPVMGLLNFLQIGDNEFRPGDLVARLKNCIIYGSLETELVLDNSGGGSALFDVVFENCIIRRMDALPGGIGNINNKMNEDPKFTDIANWNYTVDASSPAKGAAQPIPSISDDIVDAMRGGMPTIGCYE